MGKRERRESERDTGRDGEGRETRGEIERERVRETQGEMECVCVLGFTPLRDREGER